MHLKFQFQFAEMAREVQKRDDIIENLKAKIKSKEIMPSSPRKKNKSNLDKLNTVWDDEEAYVEDITSSSSSAELLFMRGDSLDTVFMTSPSHVSRHTSSSPISSNFNKDTSGYNSNRNLHINKSEDNISIGKPEKGNYIITFSDLKGNLEREDSTVLDMEDSSSSSSLSSKINVRYENIERKHRNFHHNDWEAKMLAAEMDKQERKRARSTEFEISSPILSRRRKFSKTETDLSETDPEVHVFALSRPRASSLDQFKFRHGNGNYYLKAANLVRNRNKL